MTRSSARPANIHFQIDRITLHGFSAGQRTRFLDSLQVQLTALAAQGTIDWAAQQEMAVQRVDGGRMRTGSSPEQAAELVASRVMATLAPRGDTGAPRARVAPIGATEGSRATVAPRGAAGGAR